MSKHDRWKVSEKNDGKMRRKDGECMEERRG